MCSTLVSSLLFFQTHHAWSAHNLLPDYLNHPNAGHFKLILKNNNWITPLPDDPSLLLFHAAQAYNAAETDMAEQRTVEAAAKQGTLSSVSASSMGYDSITLAWAQLASSLPVLIRENARPARYRPPSSTGSSLWSIECRSARKLFQSVRPHPVLYQRPYPGA